MERYFSYLSLYRLPLSFLFVSVLFLIFYFVPSNTSVETADMNFVSTENDIESDSNIVIDIAGAIAKPGIYELKTGARVFEVIEKAGGLLPTADSVWISKHLNKAQVLNDGDKLYIPVQGEEVKGELAVEGSVLGERQININTASVTELEALPGIGEKTAQKIIEARPYNSKAELREKNVVGEATYEKIEKFISTL